MKWFLSIILLTSSVQSSGEELLRNQDELMFCTWIKPKSIWHWDWVHYCKRFAIRVKDGTWVIVQEKGQ